MWKKKWQAKGFGISPRGGKFDYNLQPAEHYSRESFEVFYGNFVCIIDDKYLGEQIR